MIDNEMLHRQALIDVFGYLAGIAFWRTEELLSCRPGRPGEPDIVRRWSDKLAAAEGATDGW